MAEKKRRKTRAWEKFPELPHLYGEQRSAMERRRRHKFVRYWLFRIKDALDRDLPMKGVELLPGFLSFWTDQVPEYKVGPKGDRIDVPEHLRDRAVGELGGYPKFAILWDVDAELNVYLRHSSVWQEWDALLAARVPVLGEH